MGHRGSLLLQLPWRVRPDGALEHVPAHPVAASSAPLWLPSRTGALLVPPSDLSLDGRIRDRNAAGRWLGEKPLRRFFKRYGRFVFLAESKVGLVYTLKTVRRSKLESIMSYKDLLEERVECHPPVFPGRICLWVKGPH